MSMTTAPGSGASILTPDQVSQLVIIPLISQSVAMQSSTVVQTASHQLRVPRVTADAQAAWTAEGAEIAVTDATLDEVDIVPKKLAGLTVISNELAADTSPAALGVVGDSLVRDLARKLDSAFFGSTVTNGPAGLGSLTTNATAKNGGTWANLDWAEAAKSVAEQHNSTVDVFACAPATALALSTLKEYGTAGSNRPLLQSDPSAPTSRTISGATAGFTCRRCRCGVGSAEVADHHGAAARHAGSLRQQRLLQFRQNRGACDYPRELGIHRPAQHYQGNEGVKCLTGQGN